MKLLYTLPLLATSALALPTNSQKAEGLQRRGMGGDMGGMENITDADILNFALNLEYLEAEFYSRAAFGHGLMDNMTYGKGSQGSVKGGRQVSFKSDVLKEFACEIAADEVSHVEFIRQALGDAAIAEPDIDIDSSFTAAARAAGVVGQQESFDAYASETNFLLAAFIFEDVGVTAYKGAAPLIKDSNTLSSAAGILAVEAYHASELRTSLYGLGQKTSSLIQGANKISKARDSLSGGADQGIQMNGKANIVPADENAVAFGRTPGAVLDIVYLNGDADVSKGGFFPNGVNGALATTAGASAASSSMS